MLWEILNGIQVNKVLKCLVIFKKKKTIQQKLFSVKWAHTPYIIYPMTNFITISLFGKNYLDQIYSLRVALSSHKLKVQMPGWKHSLNHLFVLLFYSDTLMLWEKCDSSRKSWYRMTRLMRKHKKATQVMHKLKNVKGHFNQGFDCF